jgi:uncharacterized protein (TIGR03067 family)
MNRLVIVLLAGGLLAARPTDDPNKADLDKMQGNWAAVSMTVDGTTLSDDEAQSIFRTVKGDAYSVLLFSKVLGTGTFRIDATKTPKHIDAFPGSRKGVTMKGVYELDGKRLRVCFSGPGKERPADLTSKSGSGRTLTVWEREEK